MCGAATQSRPTTCITDDVATSAMPRCSLAQRDERGWQLGGKAPAPPERAPSSACPASVPAQRPIFPLSCPQHC